MPRCKHCGNQHFFASSQVPPVSWAANGAISGIIGDFNEDQLLCINSMGADKAIIRSATKAPQDYFDLCPQCGGQEIEWLQS